MPKPIQSMSDLHVGVVRAALAIIVCGIGLTARAESPSPSDYEQARPVFWNQVYTHGGDTLYCSVPFQRYDRRVNIEHVFPMSWVTRSLQCGTRDECRRRSSRFNRIEADLHNLYPSLVVVNKERASFGYSLIKGERFRFRGCDFEVDYRRRRVEPAPEARGRIARAMFYMHWAHDLTLFRKQAKLLREWHRQYPPKAEEVKRNDIIERIQGNRNPFIDDPASVNNLNLF